MRVFLLNDRSQDTYRLYDQNGTKFVGVVQLIKPQKGCSQVPLFSMKFSLLLSSVQLCTLFSFLSICVISLCKYLFKITMKLIVETIVVAKEIFSVYNLIKNINISTIHRHKKNNV